MAKSRHIFGVTVSLLMLTGCSVGMALSGDRNPDIGAVQVGSTRGEAEMQLGSPVRTSASQGGTRIDVYEYQIGNEPSAGRAIAHGAMDVLTFGLWEVAGAPIEAVQGEKYEAHVTYDEQDRITDIRTRKVGGGI